MPKISDLRQESGSWSDDRIRQIVHRRDTYVGLMRRLAERPAAPSDDRSPHTRYSSTIMVHRCTAYYPGGRNICGGGDL
jgi:hypothetical protein